MRNLKYSTLPAATMTLIHIYNLFFSNEWVAMINKEAGKKHTLLYSNIAGFNKPVHYGGQEVTRFFYLGSGAGTISTAITMVSINGRM